MIKQLVAFIAAAGFSMSASAHYIQYGLRASFDDGKGGMSGYFVQDLVDASIVYYNFEISGPAGDRLVTSPDGTHLIRGYESYFYRSGPTSFRFADSGTGPNYHEVNLIFNWESTPGSSIVRVSGGEDTIPIGDHFNDPAYPPVYRQIGFGYLLDELVDPDLAAALDAGQIYVNHRPVPWDPPPIPEPGSLALLAIGAGAAFVRRRRAKG
jgi:hypothetical protein